MPEQFEKPKYRVPTEELRKLAKEAETWGKEEETIRAKTPEGKELVFDLEKIKEYWIEFFQKHNLLEIAQGIKDLKLHLTPEQTARIKEKAEQGFDRLILFPSPELQAKHLAGIKEETEKPIPGLASEQQYSNEGTYLSDTVKPNFPQNIKTLNRPKGPYLLFIKDTPEVEEETKNKTAVQLRQQFQEQGETGLTLAEYFIFQRNYTETHQNEPQPHPDTKDITWLLDSEVPSARVLRTGWGPGYRQVEVGSSPSDGLGEGLGARPSVILEF